MDRQTTIMRIRRRIGSPAGWIAAATCLVGICVVMPASASETADRAMFEIEHVKERLAYLPELVTETKSSMDKADGAGLEASTGDADVANLRQAVSRAFDVETSAARVIDSMEKATGSTPDVASLGSALAAYKAGTETVEHMYRDKDADVAAKLEARLASADGDAIRSLAGAMASPELAAETVLTGQLVKLALSAEDTENLAKMRDMPESQRQREFADVVASLRTEAGGRDRMEVARQVETLRLTHVLATLPDADFRAIKDLYGSDGGKAKRQALVETYREMAETANVRMLDAYLLQKANDVHNNRQPQQN